MKKFLFLLLTPVLLNSQTLCLYCENEIEISIEPVEMGRGMWGSTWICPKTGCGYENGCQVRFCAICGTEQPKKRRL